ncbi:sugar ABC transporter permease [Bifidobacterium lemurum]|uniref:Sugar ABC transporter permease n=1 Tax=Bifidobacterium lemurum TaxID=1603886 RepID=A0A261FP98_9BIFI|nr:ABC transporter permease subunit [Bifidobacterium lemurum]OZG61000.1 sugar ABC transporter permease [Bifidobacterium lemurum]QOL34793.1 sugar ABC transporter permease [Bifidobacterium lemurum]
MTTAYQNVPSSVPDVAGAKAEHEREPLVRRLAEHFRRYWQLWVMIAPTLVFVAVFAYVPMWGIQLAFRKFDPDTGLAGGEWVGLKYFDKFFHSALFGQIMTNTIRISLWTLAMGFIFPIILALLINQIGSKRIKGFVQTITYMPHFISVVVIVSMINIFLSPSTGIIGRFFGDESLLGSTTAITTVYWVSEVWQHVGWNSIIYLAALSSVDVSLYEAAKIDGAGRMQLIRHVDIPAIMPTAGILLILNMGSVLAVGFDKIYLLQNALNLPATEVIATYTYKIGILNSQFSYSTAIGLFNTVVNFLFLITANFISKKVSDTSIF